MIPQVGDRVSRQANSHRWIEVTAVGEKVFLGKLYGADEEQTWHLDEDWLSVGRPLPERWVNLYFDAPHLDGDVWRSEEDAEINALPDRKATLVHIWTDGDGNDQIERVS